MRQYELTAMLIDFTNELLSNLHTSTIAKVTAVNETTINCRPVINRVFDGKSIPLPEFIDVPVFFAQGGASYTTYPIAIGDYCILHFMERCFDAWWNGQDFVAPVEPRTHDYSDAFAVVGVKPMRQGLQIPDLITQNGDTLQIGDYEHQGDLYQIGDVTQEGNIDILGDVNLTGNYEQVGSMEVTGSVIINGNLTVNGSINFTGSLEINGVPGFTGSFATGDSRTATVQSGLIKTIA